MFMFPPPPYNTNWCSRPHHRRYTGLGQTIVLYHIAFVFLVWKKSGENAIIYSGFLNKIYDE